MFHHPGDFASSSLVIRAADPWSCEPLLKDAEEDEDDGNDLSFRFHLLELQTGGVVFTSP